MIPGDPGGEARTGSRLGQSGEDADLPSGAYPRELAIENE